MDSQPRPLQVARRMTTVPASLDYRLSKKVAELTQVVHLLFMKNHEKEIENGLLRVQLDHYKDSEHKSSQEAVVERDKAHESLSSMKRRHEEEMRQVLLRCHGLEERLAAAESARQQLQEQSASRDAEFHEWQNKYFAAQLNKEDEMGRLKQEMTNLQNAYDTTTRQLKESLDKHNEYKSQSEEKLNKTHHECQRLLSLLEINRKAQQDQQNKVKELENDLNNFRRENERLRSSAMKIQLQQQQMLHNLNQIQSQGYGGTQEEAVELEHLRQELQRYKLELFNRDQNFNRMFVDRRISQQQQQGAAVNNSILVDGRAGRLASATIPSSAKRQNRRQTQPPNSQDSTMVASNSLVGAMKREKTFSYVTSQSFDEDQTAVTTEETKLPSRPTSTPKLPKMNSLIQKLNDTHVPKQRLF